MVVVCSGCELPIQDKFLLRVLDRTWHCTCIQCADCKCFLVDKCFSRDGVIYCRQDFFKRFGIKCAGCGQGISPDELVRRAPANLMTSSFGETVYHVDCFTCAICRRKLTTGEELYVLDKIRFVCRDDCTRDVIGSNLVPDADQVSSSDEFIEFDADEYNSTRRPAAEAVIFDDIQTSNRSPDVTRCVATWSPEAMATRHLTSGAGADMSGGGGVDGDSTRKTRGRRSSTPEAEQSSMTGVHPRSSVADEDSNESDRTIDSVSNNNSNNFNGHKADCSSTADEDTPPGSDGGPTEISGGLLPVGGASMPPGAKRRGPRTTIKAKQLDTLKAAFAATPKPTRHIREQLARETGLNMRVIQVWFQNRRSKDRRIKQLNALGIRRQFFRGAHRALRVLRPGDELGLIDGTHDLFGHPGFAYFTDKDEFYATNAHYHYNDYFNEQHSGTCLPQPINAGLHLQHHVVGVPSAHHVMSDQMSLQGHLIDRSPFVARLPALGPHTSLDSTLASSSTMRDDVTGNYPQHCSTPMHTVDYVTSGPTVACSLLLQPAQTAAIETW